MLKRMSRLAAGLLTGALLAAGGACAHARHVNAKLPVHQVHGPLSVMVLGSAGPQILAGTGRANAGYMVFVDGTPRILMDLGGGTFKSIAESGAHIHTVNDILLSHLHIDHSSDLPAVVKGLYLDGAVRRSPHVKPLQIFGPDNAMHIAHFKPTSAFLKDEFGPQGEYAYLKSFVDGGHLGKFGYQAHDIPSDFHNASIHTLVDHNGLVVKAIAVDHYDAPAVAYRIDYKGRSIVFTGDTHTTTDDVERLARNADVLIYDTSIMPKDPPPRTAFHKRHTVPSRIGQVAAAAGVKELVLSHLTPKSLPNIDTIERIIRNQGFAGKISEARDLKVYNTEPGNE